MGEVHELEDRLDPDLAEVLRRKSPAERMAIAAGMWRSARLLTAAGIREAHPNWSSQQVDRETSARMARGAG